VQPRKRSRRNPIGHHRRRSTAQRRVGIGAHCACGETKPQALITGSDPITCKRCMRIRKAKSAIDRHHVAGKANDPITIKIPTNDHIAVLTEDQHDWPEQTRENPDGDPALRGAACVRGIRGTLHYLIDAVVLWVAAFLEGLSAYLTDTRGRFWWRDTPLEAFAPKH